MADETNKEEKIAKIEPTFAQQLRTKGWEGYYITEKMEDLGNPDPKQITLGCTDALGNKQILINIRTEEAVRILTEIAKKKGTKG